MIPSRRRALLTFAGLLLGVVAWLVAPASPASAHAYLDSSDPPSGAVVSSPPGQVVLSFNEPVRLIPDRILVVGPDGERVAADEPFVVGNDVTVPLGDASARGTYLVSYRVVSADSHPVAGAVTFSVGAPSEPPSVPDQSDLNDPVVRAAMSVAKYLGYAGLVLAVGPAVMLALFWPRRLPRAGLARLLVTGLGLVTLATVFGLWFQVPYTTGGGLFDVEADGLRDVLGSAYGTAHIVRLGLVVALAILLRPLLAGTATRTDLILLGGLGVATLATWPLTGHAIASPIPVISVVVTTIHIAAAAFWLGGLVVLAGFLLRRANRQELEAILPAWSRWAALAVSWLVLAGIILALLEVAPWDALWTTEYGRLLLIKLGLVGLVIVTAAYSRRLVRRQLAPYRPGALRVAVLVESLVLAGVLAVTSVLALTTPARTEAATPAQAQAQESNMVVLESQLYRLEMLIDPGQPGDNIIHLYAFEPDTGLPLLVEEWQATAALPAAGVEPLAVPVLPVTDNHAFGQVQLPVAGEWELRFTLRTTEIDQASVTATVPID